MELRRNVSPRKHTKSVSLFWGGGNHVKFPRECSASPLAASGGLKKLTEPKKLAWKEKGKSAPLVVFSFFSSLPFPSNSAVEKGRRKEEGSGSGQRGKGKKGGGSKCQMPKPRKRKGRRKTYKSSLTSIHSPLLTFSSSTQLSVCQTIKSLSFFLLQTSKSWKRRRNWEVGWS